jgi:hypothetical protein
MNSVDFTRLSLDDFRKLDDAQEFNKEVLTRRPISCLSWPNQRRLLYVDDLGQLWGMKDFSGPELMFYKYREVDNVIPIA